MPVDRNSSIEAVVCIPTFRRPEGLVRTLRSLIEQEGDVRFAIVIVENDAQNPVGAQRAEAVLAATNFQWMVFVEPLQGNCHAINRAFCEARDKFPSAQYLLMIDDDEVASPDWLSQMVSTARNAGAEIVGGPVIRQFEGSVSQSIREHSLNGYISGPTRQVSVIHGSGNCLIDRKVFSVFDAAPFDTSFNFLGGGDMDFFVRCRAAGFKFWWCKEAVIHETVEKDRATAAWLIRRSIRTGSINYVIDRKRALSPAAVARLQLKNILSLGLGPVRFLKIFLKTGRLLPATHPVLMAVGRTIASLGYLPTPYKASSIPAKHAMLEA